MVRRTAPADELRATTDLGPVFLFFIGSANEEIPDESGPKMLQIDFLFFVDHPNEEIPDDRRSTAAHNLSGETDRRVESARARYWPRLPAVNRGHCQRLHINLSDA
ncbi:hypothetical protein GCM10025785_01650 [Corynebacterium canis]